MPFKPCKEEPKRPIPGWLVSFGDMMMLILTFFILLVSMANRQDAALLARGLGSFRIALLSHGLPGLLSGDERVQIFNEVRARFDLPPLEPGEELLYDREMPQEELLPVESAAALPVRIELLREILAVFDPGRERLDGASLRRLDMDAAALEPRAREILVLEGHGDAGESGAISTLGWRRAQTLRRHLVDELGFESGRVEARTPYAAAPGATLAGAVVVRLLGSPGPP